MPDDDFNFDDDDDGELTDEEIDLDICEECGADLECEPHDLDCSFYDEDEWDDLDGEDDEDSEIDIDD